MRGTASATTSALSDWKPELAFPTPFSPSLGCRVGALQRGALLLILIWVHPWAGRTLQGGQVQATKN